jgi:hypothetical protein
MDCIRTSSRKLTVVVSGNGSAKRNGKNSGMITKGIKWWKCVERGKGCVYRYERKGKRRKRKDRRLYGGIILVLDNSRRSVEVSGMEESETYEECMAGNVQLFVVRAGKVS